MRVSVEKSATLYCRVFSLFGIKSEELEQEWKTSVLRIRDPVLF